MRSEPQPARVTALWFGVQLVWGAVLGISLQARYVQLTGDASLATFGVIAASGAFAAAVSQLIVGPLSDMLRRRGGDRSAFYASGALLGAASVIVFYSGASVYALLWSFVALQISLNLAIGPYQAIIPDTLPSARYGVASAWLAALGSAGNACGAVLASLLGAARSLGSVLAAGLLLSAAITLAHIRRVPLRPLAQVAPFAPTRTLIDLFVSRGLIYLGFYTILLYLYFFVASLVSNATRTTGLCVLLFTVVGTLGAAVAARPSDRSDERVVVTVGGGIVAISAIALATVQSVPAVVPIIGVAGVGWGIFLCGDWAFACRLLPPGALATMMALWNLAVLGPQMLAPLVATALLSRLGTLGNAAGPRDALLLAGAEMLIGALWIWRLPASRSGK
ncbi:MAG TPA: MFS transporter [Verrucomicrobiae bacterium]|nr:MFS transporter [Verrucomicrobiae bacterium]